MLDHPPKAAPATAERGGRTPDPRSRRGGPRMLDALAHRAKQRWTARPGS
ncbi:hypothetical protein [Streptosporangium subroseum]|nr:hypothetical protein [Streptosporangium subroseum]